MCNLDNNIDHRRCSKRASQLGPHKKYYLGQTLVSACLSICTGCLSLSLSLQKNVTKMKIHFFVQLQQSEQKLSSAKKGLKFILVQALLSITWEKIYLVFPILTTFYTCHEGLNRGMFLKVKRSSLVVSP